MAEKQVRSAHDRFDASRKSARNGGRSKPRVSSLTLWCHNTTSARRVNLPRFGVGSSISSCSPTSSSLNGYLRSVATSAEVKPGRTRCRSRWLRVRGDHCDDERALSHWETPRKGQPVPWNVDIDATKRPSNDHGLLTATLTATEPDFRRFLGPDTPDLRRRCTSLHVVPGPCKQVVVGSSPPASSNIRPCQTRFGRPAR
jgi:hypothetical protein